MYLRSLEDWMTSPQMAYRADPDRSLRCLQLHDIPTEIIAASVRHPMHVTACALAGADIATVPFKVIEQMTHHPLTDAGIAKFQADYKAVFGE